MRITEDSTNGAVLFTLIGTLVALIAPVITVIAGFYVGGITLLAGICVAILWR
jgi:uncharacterized membrane protein